MTFMTTTPPTSKSAIPIPAKADMGKDIGPSDRTGADGWAGYGFTAGRGVGVGAGVGPGVGVGVGNGAKSG